MKEEQNASSSANYDVELFHKASAHTRLFSLDGYSATAPVDLQSWMPQVPNLHLNVVLANTDDFISTLDGLDKKQLLLVFPDNERRVRVQDCNIEVVHTAWLLWIRAPALHWSCQNHSNWCQFYRPPFSATVSKS